MKNEIGLEELRFLFSVLLAGKVRGAWKEESK